MTLVELSCVVCWLKTGQQLHILLCTLGAVSLTTQHTQRKGLA